MEHYLEHSFNGQRIYCMQLSARRPLYDNSSLFAHLSEFRSAAMAIHLCLLLSAKGRSNAFADHNGPCSVDPFPEQTHTFHVT